MIKRAMRKSDILSISLEIRNEPIPLPLLAIIFPQDKPLHKILRADSKKNKMNQRFDRLTENKK